MILVKLLNLKNEIESLFAMRLPRTYGLVRSTIMINRFVVLFLFFTGSLFSEEIRKLPNDIRWVDTLLEYENLCRQIYQQAWQEIKKQSSKAEGKLAIVVDLDETVLNNNSYQVDRWEKGWVLRRNLGQSG